MDYDSDLLWQTLFQVVIYLMIGLFIMLHVIGFEAKIHPIFRFLAYLLWPLTFALAFIRLVISTFIDVVFGRD